MNKRTILMLVAAAVAALLVASCKSHKDYVYLQDMEVGQRYLADGRYEAVVHRDDRLSITVSCKNPELAIPFNIHGGSFQVASDGTIKTDAQTSAKGEGYRVDVDGNIDFPILGKLHVEGMRVSEVTNLIKRRIVEGDYMRDPIVSLEFLNFKYTVLGAVARNGSFSVDGDRVTLLEAIANAGDLTAKARTDRVAVIREVNGERQMYMHDITKRSVFDSPCFYLQQNDIVYVEPRYRKKDNEDRGWQIGTTALSAVTAICSILWAIK